MIKFFRKKPEPIQTPAEPVAAPAVAKDGFFASETDKKAFNADIKARFDMAVSRTFQLTRENLSPVNSDGGGAGYAMDSSIQDMKLMTAGHGYLPIQQFEWFGNQGFIGWQLCAMLSQNWLVDKACTMPAKDAIRNWFDIAVNDGIEIDTKILDEMNRLDKVFKLKKNCIEFVKNCRIFGIRHILFLVDGIDYELPFNPDGVRPGSYRGMTQIDPYWMAPEMDRSAASDPASKDFYEPTWWRVNGKRIHKSHFVIMRNGDDVPDLLKPTYVYGGIPTPQKIFERVYAAERTANEAPMLAMTKRLTSLKIDAAMAMANPEEFDAKMKIWTQLQNNFGVKVIGEGEEIAQYDTNLSGLDETIMTQYQLVAAAAEVPATKLMGTQPKGFNASGDYEESSYHEMLETIQFNELSAVVDRHHMLLIRSIINPKFKTGVFNTEVNWRPVNSPTIKEMAEINKLKADTDAVLSGAGAVDGFDIRQRLIKDRNSGYNGISETVEGGPGDETGSLPPPEDDAAIDEDSY